MGPDSQTNEQREREREKEIWENTFFKKYFFENSFY